MYGLDQVNQYLPTTHLLNSFSYAFTGGDILGNRMGFEEAMLGAASILPIGNIGGVVARGVGNIAAKTSTSLVTKYPANAAIAGIAERTFLMPGQVIDRYGALGGKWFSTPGTFYGARSIPPGLSPYTQFKVLKPFEVQKSLASLGMFSGQTGFSIQFQSPVDADILIKRGIIAPF